MSTASDVPTLYVCHGDDGGPGYTRAGAYRRGCALPGSSTTR
jgi:hypothetical protein